MCVCLLVDAVGDVSMSMVHGDESTTMATDRLPLPAAFFLEPRDFVLALILQHQLTNTASTINTRSTWLLLTNLVEPMGYMISDIKRTAFLRRTFTYIRVCTVHTIP